MWSAQIVDAVRAVGAGQSYAKGGVHIHLPFYPILLRGPITVINKPHELRTAVQLCPSQP